MNAINFVRPYRKLKLFALSFLAFNFFSGKIDIKFHISEAYKCYDVIAYAIFVTRWSSNFVFIITVSFTVDWLIVIGSSVCCALILIDCPNVQQKKTHLCMERVATEWKKNVDMNHISHESIEHIYGKSISKFTKSNKSCVCVRSYSRVDREIERFVWIRLSLSFKLMSFWNENLNENWKSVSKD